VPNHELIGIKYGKSLLRLHLEALLKMTSFEDSPIRDGRFNSDSRNALIFGKDLIQNEFW
jgi:hypothetical protein